MVSETLKKIQLLVVEAQDDAKKFEEKGNASAGKRIRTTIREIKSLLKVAKDETLGITSTEPTTQETV